MIHQLRVLNYKAVKDVTLDLSPFHVLIGPNDSGKTSVLEAATALCRSADWPLREVFTGRWDGLSLVWDRNPNLIVEIIGRSMSGTEEVSYGFCCKFKPDGRNPVMDRELLNGRVEPTSGHSGTLVWRTVKNKEDVPNNIAVHARICYDAFSDVHVCRWNPRLLALPVAPDADQTFRLHPSGFGLAMCLDDLLGYDRHAFGQLEQQLQRIFPRIHSIKLVRGRAFRTSGAWTQDVPALQDAEGKEIVFEMGAGQLIPASQASDGLLLVLAYLTVLHLPKPPRLLVVEEPENGIYPERLRDVLEILKGLVGPSARTQILMTTHSPYVLDSFEPQNVTLCRKLDDGSVGVRRLSESKTVREQIDVFSLGEIWTGEGEKILGEVQP